MEDFIFIGCMMIQHFQFEGSEKVYFRVSSSTPRWFRENDSKGMDRLSDHDEKAYEKEYQRMYDNGISLKKAGLIK